MTKNGSLNNSQAKVNQDGTYTFILSVNDPGVFKSGQDITGKSTHKGIYFNFPSGDYVEVVCHDWSKEIGWIDHLRIGLTSKEVSDWISVNN